MRDADKKMSEISVLLQTITYNFQLTVLERTNYLVNNKTLNTVDGDEKEKGKTHVS